MDNVKMGQLIFRLRREHHYTQLQLAEKLNISDKTVSKWERGLGCPDVSLLTGLSDIFNVDLEKLLSGELETNEIPGGNMKKLNFYICPDCHNVITSMTQTGIVCCGRKLKPLQPQKAATEERLTVEQIENDFYVTSDHPMERDHYILFVALLTGDTLMLRKQYPEWNLQVHIPVLAHGRLIWYCTKHGLFYQEV